MISLKFPDGSARDFESGVTGREVEEQIAKSLTKKAVAMELDGQLRDLYEPIARMSETLFSGDSPLSMAERQFLFTYVSNLNACQYCFGGHAAVVEALGVERAVLDAAIEDIDAAPVEARLKPLLRYVRKLNEEPTRVAQADADAVFQAGWDETALEHAIALCCLANFMNRLVEGHGVEGRPEEFAARAKLAVEHGYLKPFLMKTGREA